MISDLFEDFIKEKRYLNNLSERTLNSYRTDMFRRWIRYVGGMPTQSGINQFVVKMREEGLAISTCNITIRSLNSFLSWLYQNGHIPQNLKAKQLKQERRIMKTFTEAQMKLLLSWKPNKNRNEIRLHVLISLLADTGIRINEALTLRLENIDWDNLLIKVMGKGSKERIVPMSIELRKVLHRYATKQRSCKHLSPYLLCTSTGTQLTYQNIGRIFRAVVKSLGIEGFDSAFHAFRRFFGKNYLKNGGNLVYLQRLFGHASITTTKMYVEDIDIEDLHRAHLRSSPLSRLKS